MEEWKVVPDYPSIEINKNGDVRLVANAKQLKVYSDGHGYSKVYVVLENGFTMVRIHRLLALTFIPNPLNLTDVNHKDGNKTNNSLENLEWCSRSENIKHAFATGLKPRLYGERNPNWAKVFTPEQKEKMHIAALERAKKGIDHPRAKYNDELVHQIRLKRKETGLGNREIWRQFFPDIPLTFINDVLSGRTWKHVVV